MVQYFFNTLSENQFGVSASLQGQLRSQFDGERGGLMDGKKSLAAPLVCFIKSQKWMVQSAGGGSGDKFANGVERSALKIDCDDRAKRGNWQYN